MNACAPASFGGAIAPTINGGFTDAFDAQPSSNGSTVFFTGVDMNGNPGVFKQTICPTAGAVTAVYTGGVFEAPFGIALSSDDMTVYVADPSAAEDPTDIAKDKGCLFSLPAAGGTAPTILVGSVAPRSVTVASSGGSDIVYFTGTDKTTHMPGVFSVPAAGGSPTVIVEGAPFSDPGGIAIAPNGDLYIIDTSASGKLGAILVIPKGMTTATVFVPNVPVGYPAGIGILGDGTQLLVSAVDAYAQSDVLAQVDVTTMAVTDNTMNIGTYKEAAGLHRAATVDVFAWADTKATPTGMTGTGTVFVIK